MNKVINQFLIRSEIDSDQYQFGYRYSTQKPYTVFKRLACIVHIDDIAGLFGDALYEQAKELEPGGVMNLNVSARW